MKRGEGSPAARRPGGEPPTAGDGWGVSVQRLGGWERAAGRRVSSLASAHWRRRAIPVPDFLHSFHSPISLFLFLLLTKPTHETNMPARCPSSSSGPAAHSTGARIEKESALPCRAVGRKSNDALFNLLGFDKLTSVIWGGPAVSSGIIQYGSPWQRTVLSLTKNTLFFDRD